MRKITYNNRNIITNVMMEPEPRSSHDKEGSSSEGSPTSQDC